MSVGGEFYVCNKFGRILPHKRGSLGRIFIVNFGRDNRLIFVVDEIGEIAFGLFGCQRGLICSDVVTAAFAACIAVYERQAVVAVVVHQISVGCFALGVIGEEIWLCLRAFSVFGDCGEFTPQLRELRLRGNAKIIYRGAYSGAGIDRCRRYFHRIDGVPLLACVGAALEFEGQIHHFQCFVGLGDCCISLYGHIFEIARVGNCITCNFVDFKFIFHFYRRLRQRVCDYFTGSPLLAGERSRHIMLCAGEIVDKCHFELSSCRQSLRKKHKRAVVGLAGYLSAFDGMCEVSLVG